MSTYAELLNEGNVDIATEGFSFKELGEKILKFIGKVLDWIKRVKNRIIRFIRSLRDFKKERDADQADIKAEAQYITDEKNRINNEIDQEIERRKAQHEKKLAAANKVYHSFTSNLRKLTKSAVNFSNVMDAFQLEAKSNGREFQRQKESGSYWLNVEKCMQDTRNFENASTFKATIFGKFEFEPPEFPEIEHENFESTCNSIAYCIASMQFFKKESEDLLRGYLRELESAENSLNKSKRDLESWIPKVNSTDVQQIQPVLMATQKYAAKIGTATQCIERSITLTQTTQIEYGVQHINAQFKAKSQVTGAGLNAELSNVARQTQHDRTFKSRFSKEYQSYYNKKYPISGE